jgi:hypothetical protein
MTTHPDTTASTDRVLAARAASHGEYLGGLLSAAMLDVVGQPAKLPELLFPDLDPDLVLRVWKAALPVGYRLGKLAERPQFDEAGLRRLRAALHDAGYRAMGGQVDRSLSTTAHPADTDPARERP